MRFIVALAFVLAMSATASWAQPPPAPQPRVGAAEARTLASMLLDRYADEVMTPLLGASKVRVVGILQRNGWTEQKAGDVFDQYMAPEFRTRMPELRAKFEDILVQDFTVPELQAIVENSQNDARRTAAAKAGQMRTQFTAAGEDWSGRVDRDVFEKNKDVLEKLHANQPYGSTK